MNGFDVLFHAGGKTCRGSNQKMFGKIIFAYLFWN